MAREMKDSGVEWIGEIPREWEVVKLKSYFSFEKGKNASMYTQEYIGQNIGEFPVYSGQTENDGIMGKINSYDYDIEECLFTTTVGAKVMTPKILKGKFNLSQNCLIMKKEKECNIKFFYYMLLPLFSYEKSLIPNYMQPSLRMEDLRRYKFYIPSLEEQEKIANYLDKKVSDIDLIIEKTKATIEDYKKYKQSIITEAVTNGINPNVEMKDSGIEWIGEIPRHWGNKRLKQISYIRARLGWKGLKAEEYTQEGYMFLSAFNIINSKLDFTETNFINSYRYEESPEIKLKVGDVLIVKDGAGIGKCAYVEYLPNEATINGSIALISTNEELKGKFLYYYFLTKIMQKYVDRLKDGMGVPHLFQKDIKEIRICIPPLKEQNQIAEYLDKKTSEIDTLITKKEALIAELEEYKKSLIYECVTGKKEIK